MDAHSTTASFTTTPRPRDRITPVAPLPTPAPPRYRRAKGTSTTTRNWLRAHISAGSPCIGAGSSAYSTVWTSTASLGRPALHGGRPGGLARYRPVGRADRGDFTNVAVGFPVRFVAQNQGRLLATLWDFGDGTVVSNQAFITHAWTNPGTYEIRLTGYNDRCPGE